MDIATRFSTPKGSRPSSTPPNPHACTAKPIISFAVYYDITAATADVKAALDSRRDPQWIKRQLQRP